MIVISTLALLVRIGLAVLLGGVIGLEREVHGRPAGLRTHMLVCLGSALIMLVSAYGVYGLYGGDSAPSFDPTRIAAQIVSGIGFLGAGTIMKEGPTIRGLTTAASLWVAATIGMAVGAGFYLGALVVTLLVVLVLGGLDKYEYAHLLSKSNRLVLKVVDRPGQLAAVTEVLAGYKINITRANLHKEDETRSILDLVLEIPGTVNKSAVLTSVIELDGVEEARYANS